jgi:SpoVK/Ycf46/Vps4 family AAA+-type ATPase
MSKWVGETEKNLAGIFDAAERTQAVLQFDEADALFSQRTQVNDAQDRYVNLHTAYLLQRLDHFRGLVVLTTNLRQNIDPAFVRRMDFVVEFPLPDEENRARLWQLHLPSRAALADDLDIPILARLYPIPGGWIRNAAVAAAFLAASQHTAISRRHLVMAVRREYAKAVRPFPGVPTPATVMDDEIPLTDTEVLLVKEKS